MSNKVKLNDKKRKKVKFNGDKYISEDSKEIRNFLIILFSIIIIVLIIYGVSRYFIKDEDTNTEDTITEGTIDYDKVSVGTMLNRHYDEYYVAIYDEENPKAVLYSAIITNYLNNENITKVFFCDLGNKLNSKYYVGSDGVSNPQAQNINEFAFEDLTLIKVKDGKIIKYLEDFEKIKEELTV